MNTSLDPTVIAKMARAMDELHSVPIIVLPDDDRRFDRVPPGGVVSDGQRFYVPETLWPGVRAELLKLRPASALIQRPAS